MTKSMSDKLMRWDATNNVLAGGGMRHRPLEL
eukprot:CAMPEP_0170413930 /NCGR_PEP_ID=MMETSP0117_2-20130122/31795_1 /TAXON_ID=400756 /ORGANISM="Durinskia baltica, Strain CSIRO CS-38" /LENGTH=31 /DNA_ID= /DNA_START= /DNA_END= /DNA_ORIENTATION=